jgi:anhydro-N-acetylmuramic acid kinase
MNKAAASCNTGLFKTTNPEIAEPMTTESRKPLTALGLMSGTSMDGVDAAVIETDGVRVFGYGPVLARPYDDGLRSRIRAVLGGVGAVEEVAREITLAHLDAVEKLLRAGGLTASSINVIGFHGQTVLHRPELGKTLQIGDPALLAARTGVKVVADFRTADVAAGGQGAPFAPLYHATLAADLEKPLAVLNIGGVANVTWIDQDGELIAFDTGPGNALMDDWTARHGIGKFDTGGALARSGRPDPALLSQLLSHDYFSAPPPKSLDRDDFASIELAALNPADGAATLAAFTARSVGLSRAHLPGAPKRWLVCGGGRHNGYLLSLLQDALEVPVAAVEKVGWRGDSLEAEAFAFLAVRSLRGLPLSLPSTTGVPSPMPGGVLFAAG